MEFFPTQVRDDKTLLRREFLKLSLVHHPDKEPDPNLKASATSTFQRIQSAYDDLCNVLNGKCPSDAKVALRTKSLLSAACEVGDYDKVQRLLKVRPAWAREADEVGKTPLMYAVEAGSLEICKELVKARASIHDHNRSGWTALVMAAIRDQADIAGWLLESGATLSDPVFQLAAHVGGAGVTIVAIGCSWCCHETPRVWLAFTTCGSRRICILEESGREAFQNRQPAFGCGV